MTLLTQLLLPSSTRVVEIGFDPVWCGPSVLLHHFFSLLMYSHITQTASAMNTSIHFSSNRTIFPSLCVVLPNPIKEAVDFRLGTIVDLVFSCWPALYSLLLFRAVRDHRTPELRSASFVQRLFARTGSLDYILLFPLKPMHVV